MPLSPSSLNGYEFKSHAEEGIYVAAAESQYFNNNEKYLFHSLNMVKTGGKKIKGEIDFVYMDRDCILFLEVKGGSVKFDSLRNQWFVLGGTEPGDPFDQAYKALFFTRTRSFQICSTANLYRAGLCMELGFYFPTPSDLLSLQNQHQVKWNMIQP